MNLSKLSENQLFNLKSMRWKARTDLQYLAHDILGYPDVQRPLHTPVLDILQQFPVPNRQQFSDNDKLIGNRWEYKPITSLYDLPGDRRVLIIDPRSFLKTTINAQSHTIQWIINYPEINILITQANIDRASDILREIKGHFQENPKLRALFPEHCPWKRVMEWGTKTEFNTEARKKKGRESTVMVASIERGMAGYHFDVLKFSDIVDDENSKTKPGLMMVVNKFADMENLVVRPDSWIDVEGTRYDFSDLYGKLIDKEKERRKSGKRLWKIHVRGAYAKKLDGPPTYDIEEMDKPFLRDPREVTDTNPLGLVAIWKSRWHHESLQNYKEEHGSVKFANHKLNNPISGDEKDKIFPIQEGKYPKIITPDLFRKNVRIAYYTTTVDTGESQNDKSDFTAIVTVGWAADGKAYVIDIRHDRYLPDEIIHQIFLVYKKFKPISIKVEKTGFAHGLFSGIGRIQNLGRPVVEVFDTPLIPSIAHSTKNIILPIELIPRANDLSKLERIKFTLQPWYKSGDLVFLEDLEPWPALITELSRFPKYEHDDILDALSDQFQGKEWFGREIERKPSKEQIHSDLMDQFLGVEVEDWYNLESQVLPLPN